ncbi:SigE family RNA polymerase sigma factor [Plantactinospora siamensis]|uniref:SigE family RNA polymerase sigma factor n=1 Tax=Plantactinospora siamensis TaxID=555372 RepID=A0ABV6NV98_9ACTN
MAASDALEEEFREFVAARSGALLRTAYLLAGDWATAEDLLQTALTKTYLAWKRLGGIEAVEPYARRVLVNTATSWWRRRWHGERPTEVLPEQPARDRIHEQLERDALWRHVQDLPARQRAVLVLRFYEDLSEAQTAALLNISAGTVKSQTSRALATLRRRLAAEEAVERARDVPAATGTARGSAAGPRAGRPTAPTPVGSAPVRPTAPALVRPTAPAPVGPTHVPAGPPPAGPPTRVRRPAPVAGGEPARTSALRPVPPAPVATVPASAVPAGRAARMEV